MTTAPFRIDAFWLRAQALMRVFDALQEVGDVRVVGGAVRNTLLGQPIGDVDLATTARPGAVTRVLRDAGMRVIETGVDHGTVTVVSHGQAYEVTTLREDVSTDGRRATVAFTEDWATDASRRDFTMNALYVDRDGNGYDYVGGYADCLDQHVRFIGDADQRIVEDYLRILRLFRFHAAYGRGELDTAALAAARAHKHGLRTLSVERVHHELTRLLMAPCAVGVMDVIADDEFLDAFTPRPIDVETLRGLIEAEERSGREPSATLRYAALMSFDLDSVVALAHRLRFSRRDKDRAVAAIAAAAELPPKSVPQARAMIYRHGVQAFTDAIMVDLAIGVDLLDHRTLLAEARRFSPPPFPVTGTDLMAAGVEAGPELGDRLRRLERIWLESDFSLSREALLSLDREAPTTR